MTWSLYNQKGESLPPLKYSNGKTQEDVVNEVLDAIKRGHKVIFIKGQCGSGKCLGKDTRVFCKPEGKDYDYYEISDLVNKEGSIYCLNKKGDIVESSFTNVRKTGKKSVYCLKTRCGREIKASETHPFLTITEKGIEWKELRDLRTGDFICLPGHIRMKARETLDVSKLKILGYLISEGKLKGTGSPEFSQSLKYNQEIRNDYIGALRKVFPEGEIVETKWDAIRVNFWNRDTRFGTTNKLRLFIRQFGLDGKKSKEKFVPGAIFELNNHCIAEFLKALFSGDGSIYEKSNKNRKKQVCVEYSSISPQLINDVSLLLTRFGIQHTITNHKFRRVNDYSKRILISSQPEVKKFIDNVGFIGRKQQLALQLRKRLKDHKFTNIDKVPRVIRSYLRDLGHTFCQLDRYLNYKEIEPLRRKIGWKGVKRSKLVKTPFVFGQHTINFLRRHVKTVNKFIKDDILSFVCNEDIFWDKVKSIEYAYKGETYDLEVEEHHTFIADGIIVHNSALALNIAKELGRASIVVPVKYLQKQYEEDYTNKLYLLKDDKEKLRIKIITGRNNHKCLYNPGCNADDRLLPCDIEIKKENFELIRAYIKNNPHVSLEDFETIDDVRRFSVAAACPYWSPLVPREYFNEGYITKGTEAYEYEGLKKQKFIYLKRKPGCTYYEQFKSYLDSDIIIFNSKKYEFETMVNRKPNTEVEIIDECDEFLDSLGNERRINLTSLMYRLRELETECKNFNMKSLLGEGRDLVEEILGAKWLAEMIEKEEILKLKDTHIIDLVRYFLDNEDLLEYDDLEQYYEIAKSFEDLFESTYVGFVRSKKNNVILKIVNINLEKKFHEMLEKNKTFVMMSGTIHSRKVLQEIFGVKDFVIVEAETENLGNIRKIVTKRERNFRYKEFAEGTVTREEYLQALDVCVRAAELPALVHINSFLDLPTEEEKETLGLSVISRERLQEQQEKYKHGELLQWFKEGKLKILYSTKCNRGVDFPGEMCNSIIFTKYPYSSMDSIFWKMLKQTKPEEFMDFYFDKANREFLQRLYRGLRSKHDKVNILSPDIKVLKSLAK